MFPSKSRIMDIIGRKMDWAAGIAVASLAASCGHPAPAPGGHQQGPVAIKAGMVRADSAMYYDRYPGTVTALNEVEIRPQVSGYITGIYFQDGDYVRKGQKLYSLDEQTYLANYRQADANLNVSIANFEKARQDAGRYRELAKEDAIARQTLDHALSDSAAADMQVEAARETVKSVQTNLRYASLYSPVNGTIGISQVKLGAAVSQGSTILNTVSADDPLGVDFNVDEKELARFGRLRTDDRQLRDSVFALVLPDGTVYPYPGKILLLDRFIDAQTATIKTRLVFPNPDRVLKTGLSCTVRVRSEAGKSLLIPTKALMEQMGEFFVFVIHDRRAIQQRITIGRRIDTATIVTQGLQAGQQIAVEGIQKLRDSSQVQY